MDAVKKELQSENYQFYTGTSYRHCMIWKNGTVVELTPPHDHLTEVIHPYLPQDAMLREMQKRSYEILANAKRSRMIRKHQHAVILSRCIQSVLYESRPRKKTPMKLRSKKKNFTRQPFISAILCRR